MSIKPHSQGLSAQDLYLFDTMGFLHLPGFLSRGDVDNCLDEVSRLGASVPYTGGKQKIAGLVESTPLFRDIAGSTEVRDCVEPLINQPLRLIESYVLRRETNSIFYLHNGNSELLRYGGDKTAHRNMGLTHTFHDGKLYCMFVKVMIYLTDIQTVEDGPFCYLQGSHKANFPWFPDGNAGSPSAAATATGAERPILTRENIPSLEHVFAAAGDALVLNEALLHGTLPKTTDTERILAAFCYAPAFVTDWSRIETSSDDLDQLGHY